MVREPLHSSFCYVKIEQLREDQAALKARAEEAEQENARLAHHVEDWRGKAAAANFENQQLQQEARNLRRAYEVFFHRAYRVQNSEIFQKDGRLIVCGKVIATLICAILTPISKHDDWQMLSEKCEFAATASLPW